MLTARLPALTVHPSLLAGRLPLLTARFSMLTTCLFPLTA